MNFGVRLPGPFRVGISSNGRVNAGVTAGPFSISTNVGGGTGPQTMILPRVTIDQAAHAIAAEGWTVTYRTTREVHAEHRWQARIIEAHPHGVSVRSAWSSAKTNAVSIAVVAACAILAVVWILAVV